MAKTPVFCRCYMYIYLNKVYLRLLPLPDGFLCEVILKK